MKRLLAIWIEDQAQHNVPASSTMIQEEAKSLFLILKYKNGEEAAVALFTANKGWFPLFKKSCNIHSINITGETANANSEKAITICVLSQESNRRRWIQ
jgi:hypothetical protein